MKDVKNQMPPLKTYPIEDVYSNDNSDNGKNKGKNGKNKGKDGENNNNTEDKKK